MEAERAFAEFICETGLGDVPEQAVAVAKDQVLAVTGTVMGGAWEQGCEAVVEAARELGGKPEASILVHGGKVPAQQAAFANGLMARALDFCDALAPGAHIGSAVIPAALAAAELVGGVSGELFLTAVCVATEIGLRLNLEESQYDGFDPTGVCVPFAATAAAAKVLALSETDTWNALALAFNRSGGSFQSNVDGSLAVRTIQGWVAETGIVCARLAAHGLTGPANFLHGVYGYAHLFGRDRLPPEKLIAGLGVDYHATHIVFKKYPSCGATQGTTDVVLALMADEGLTAADVARVEVRVPPYVYRLVGKPFRPGANPKVDAQFSIRYCVANALVSEASELRHFEEAAVRRPEVLALAESVEVTPDASLDARGHTSLDLRLLTKDEREFVRKSDLPPGAPGRPLSTQEHLDRFYDTAAYAPRSFPDERLREIANAIAHLEEMPDVRTLVTSLILD